MSEKNRQTAAILAMLLGSLGAHKFYLGRPVAGIFYLLFFWTGLPGLIAFAEGLIYLFQSDAEFGKKFNPQLVSEPRLFLGDPIDTLRRLEALRQEGLISDEEFEEKRRKMIDRIG